MPPLREPLVMHYLRQHCTALGRQRCIGLLQLHADVLQLQEVLAQSVQSWSLPPAGWQRDLLHALVESLEALVPQASGLADNAGFRRPPLKTARTRLSSLALALRRHAASDNRHAHLSSPPTTAAGMASGSAGGRSCDVASRGRGRRSDEIGLMLVEGCVASDTPSSGGVCHGGCVLGHGIAAEASMSASTAVLDEEAWPSPREDWAPELGGGSVWADEATRPINVAPSSDAISTDLAPSSEAISTDPALQRSIAGAAGCYGGLAEYSRVLSPSADAADEGVCCACGDASACGAPMSTAADMAAAAREASQRISQVKNEASAPAHHRAVPTTDWLDCVTHVKALAKAEGSSSSSSSSGGGGAGGGGDGAADAKRATGRAEAALGLAVSLLAAELQLACADFVTVDPSTAAVDSAWAASAGGRQMPAVRRIALECYMHYSLLSMPVGSNAFEHVRPLGKDPW